MIDEDVDSAHVLNLYGFIVQPIIGLDSFNEFEVYSFNTQRPDAFLS